MDIVIQALTAFLVLVSLSLIMGAIDAYRESKGKRALLDMWDSERYPRRRR